ncbi:MAG: LON peptidase substrate-binding domain-containing protein [Phycisphaerales bacterium]|nr:LON peptidase substrate-binding domain-containing protein [Phycisphaerales bacterium]
MASELVQVSFKRPFPVFVLPHVALLPHALVQLFIFEPRYTQMMSDILDTSGQFAMAVCDGDCVLQDNPPIRSTVCLGQIVRHVRNDNGTFHVWVRGLCRARVVAEQLPTDLAAPEGRLYRTARLEPLEEEDASERDLAFIRADLMDLLHTEPLRDVGAFKAVVEQIEAQDEEVPTPALVDIVSLSLLSVMDDFDLRYQLLSQGGVFERARTLQGQLRALRAPLAQAERQYDPDAPKGVSWN